jgi:hypothetical protein
METGTDKGGRKNTRNFKRRNYMPRKRKREI